MPQTSVQQRLNKWLTEGQLASTKQRDIDGALQYAKNGNAVLPFGRVSKLTIATNIVTPLDGAIGAGEILVIPIFTEKFGLKLDDLYANNGSVGYPANYENVEYITEGDVVMYSETAGNVGQPVAYRHTAASSPNDVVGRIRNAAVVDEAVAMTTVFYAEQISAAGLVACRVGRIGL